MGAKYTNIVVRAEAKKVAGYLKYARHSAYLSPASKGGTTCTVCQEEIDPQPLAQEISEKLGCVAVSLLNDDDDQFWYQLWDSGRLIDEHASTRAGSTPRRASGRIAPDEWTPDSDKNQRGSNEVWGEDPDDSEAGHPGDPAALCAAFDRPGCVADVRKILESAPADQHRWVPSSSYHFALAELLDWPEERTSSFEAISDAIRRGDPVAQRWLSIGNADQRPL